MKPNSFVSKVISIDFVKGTVLLPSELEIKVAKFFLEKLARSLG